MNEFKNYSSSKELRTNILKYDFKNENFYNTIKTDGKNKTINGNNKNNILKNRSTNRINEMGDFRPKENSKDQNSFLETCRRNTRKDRNLINVNENNLGEMKTSDIIINHYNACDTDKNSNISNTNKNKDSTRRRSIRSFNKKVVRLKKYRTHGINNKLKNENGLGSFRNSNFFNNINININIQQLEKENEKNKCDDSYFKENILEIPSKEQTELNKQDCYDKNTLKRRRSKYWNKLSNFFIGIKGFKKLDTNYITGDNDIEKELKTYEEKYYIKRNSINNNYKDKDIEKLENSMVPKMDPLSKEFFKLSLKESAYKIITEGSTKQIEELEEIIKKDPDSNIIEIKNKNSLFNIPMSNGRTLLYIACQEGKTEIIEFLLKKGLDPSIKSIIGEGETENCLDVAVRWNFIKIIQILLESKKFSEQDIKNILGRRNLKKQNISILKDYIRILKGKKSCMCF